MADELLSLDWVLGCLIVLGCLRCSEVMAFDNYAIALIELSQHFCPLVGWVRYSSRREHDILVRSTFMVLVCFDCVDCFLINHDGASCRFLSSEV